MKELHEQYKVMCQFQDQVEKDCVIPVEIAEVLYSNPMMKLYTSLSQVLKDNNVLKDNEKLQEKKFEKMAEYMVKVQNKLLDQQTKEDSQISQLICHMETEIKEESGGGLSKDTQNLLHQSVVNF